MDQADRCYSAPGVSCTRSPRGSQLCQDSDCTIRPAPVAPIAEEHICAECRHYTFPHEKGKLHACAELPVQTYPDIPMRCASFDPAYEVVRVGLDEPLPKAFGKTTIATETAVRRFETGACRDTDDDKLDFEGFDHPLVTLAYAEYMHENRTLKDGSMRAADNWQAGIPKDVYMKSGWRHFFDWWCEHRDVGSREGLVKALCGLIFNAKGYLYEVLKEDRAAEHDEPLHLSRDAT